MIVVGTKKMRSRLHASLVLFEKIKRIEPLIKRAIAAINKRLESSDPESIFLILRQMCFNNKNFNIEGDWSIPESLKVRKIITK